jgi:eukaryotic-like serine/threonine-protein kinase
MSDSATGTLPRRTLGPYRLLRRLGAGGMAEVFLAVAYGASGFEKRVAVKTLLPELRDNPQLQRSLIEEARLGARLQHRNLVQVHDLGVADGVYYVRMDYVDGPDLRTLLAARRPPPELALLVAEEVALALRFVHLATDDDGRPLGLVHRDISPSNVLVSRAGEVKLADFGVAKATMLADVTQANVLKGKYSYMSPEQVKGEPLSPRSDQFSFGVTLVELLCGRRPYDGTTPLETMELVRSAAPPDLQPLDQDLQALLLRCLAATPDGRFPDDDQLLRALAACRQIRAATIADLACWVAG